MANHHGFKLKTGVASRAFIASVANAEKTAVVLSIFR